jgi:prepilin-type N-terminal cleavage/methylation domain-containing protein
MKVAAQSIFGKARRGFTIMEMLIATSVGGLAIAMVITAFTFSVTSFSAMGNYADLDRYSRNAVDVLSKNIRNSSALMSFSSNNPMYLQFTNSTAGTSFTVNYNALKRTLSYSQNGGSSRLLLTNCDTWSFSLYSKAPILTTTNIIFYGATNGSGQLDASVCKLINMTWKCSRSIFGSKRNTETIQTAEIVLRNKVN